MKSVKLMLAVATFFLAMSSFTVPTASAQIFDGEWFKLVAKVKAYSVDPATGDYSMLKFSQDVYLLFELIAGGPVPGTAVDYNLTTYTETAPGVWTPEDQGSNETIPASESFLSDVNLVLPGEGGSFIEIYNTPYVQIKTDALGALTSAKYKALGEVYYGEDGSGNEIYGDVSIKGKRIDVSKLPFVP